MRIGRWGADWDKTCKAGRDIIQQSVDLQLRLYRCLLEYDREDAWPSHPAELSSAEQLQELLEVEDRLSSFTPRRIRHVTLAAQTRLGAASGGRVLILGTDPPPHQVRTRWCDVFKLAGNGDEDETGRLGGGNTHAYPMGASQEGLVLHPREPVVLSWTK